MLRFCGVYNHLMGLYRGVQLSCCIELAAGGKQLQVRVCCMQSRPRLSPEGRVHSSASLHSSGIISHLQLCVVKDSRIYSSMNCPSFYNEWLKIFFTMMMCILAKSSYSFEGNLSLCLGCILYHCLGLAPTAVNFNGFINCGTFNDAFRAPVKCHWEACWRVLNSSP